jgi:hypothetical protein
VVSVKQPEIEHKVRIADFQNWLDSVGKSPAENGFEKSSAGHS